MDLKLLDYKMHLSNLFYSSLDKTEITKQFKDALSRQPNEAVLIFMLQLEASRPRPVCLSVCLSVGLQNKICYEGARFPCESII